MDNKEFGRRLMYQWPADDETQRSYDEHARELSARFSVKGAAIPNGARVDFRNHIDHLRVSQGIEVAFDRLEKLRDTGLSADLYATAGMIAARRAGEYTLASNFLLGAHDRWADNPAIFVLLLETLISADRVDEAVSRIANVNRPQPQQVPLSSVGLRLAELAALCGAWPDVERFIRTVVPEPVSFAARCLTTRIEYATEFTGQTHEIPAYVLNMAEDRRKLGLLTHLYGNFDLLPQRIEAVDGRLIDAARIEESTSPNGAKIGKGALGCALGHLSMWERFLEGPSEYALFLEDDGLPYTWRDLTSVAESAGGFDVLLVNERMSAVKAGAISTGVSSVWDALGTRPDSVQGWGADGYLLSRVGAEKLLDATGLDRVLGHIDGQIAAYGIQPGVTPLNLAQRIGAAKRRASRYSATLNIKCLDFPLVASMDFGDSTIGRVGGHNGQ